MNNIRHANSNEVQARVDQYYRDSYEIVHGTGALGEANHSLHRQLESRKRGKHFPVTLELGSGNFEHLSWVTHSYSKYICLDARRPAPAVMEKLKEFPNAEFLLGDATKLDFHDNSVDRVVVTCLLMHLPDPITALKEWQRVCKPGGIIEFIVPTDPGIAIRAFRKIFSERAVKKQGLDPHNYRLVTAFDHISSFPRLLTLAQSSLEGNNKLKVEYFPFPWAKSFNLNAFATFRLFVS